MTIRSLAGRVDAVAIGASAGGVEALSALLPALPRDAAVAVFVVLHLPRERRSLLVEILKPRCALDVREALDKEPIEPGIVYVAPPDYHLLVERGPAIALSVDPLVNFSRPAIDVAFESAAEVYGNRLLGIILTGASHDGAAGLEVVHRAGGLTIAQDPASAHSPVMTQAAIARGAADVVLTLEDIARLLATVDRLDRLVVRPPDKAES